MHGHGRAGVLPGRGQPARRRGPPRAVGAGEGLVRRVGAVDVDTESGLGEQIIDVGERVAVPHHRLGGHVVVESDGGIEIGEGHGFAPTLAAQRQPGEAVQRKVGVVGEDQTDRATNDRVDDRGVHPHGSIGGQTPVEDVAEHRWGAARPLDQLGAAAGAVDLLEHPDPGRGRCQHQITGSDHAAQGSGPIDDGQILGPGVQQGDQCLERRPGQLDRGGRVRHHHPRGGVRGEPFADNPAAQRRVRDDSVGSVTRVDDRAVHVAVGEVACGSLMLIS